MGQSGAFVVLIGPDGSGKTTLARELVRMWNGPTAYFHFRPRLRRPFRSEPPTSSAPPAGGKQKPRSRGDLIIGWVRLVHTVAQCFIVYWTRIQPAVRRGQLVVADRWLFGYLTQPGPLRYYGPQWAAYVLLRLMPDPSLTINLTAPVPVLLERKQELSAQEMERELHANRRLPVTNVETLSAEEPPAQLAARVLELLETRQPASR